MPDSRTPDLFLRLLADGCIGDSELLRTSDGFVMVYRSLSDILAVKNIHDFPDSTGERLFCDRFFDDWFLYAVPHESDFTYALHREKQETGS